MKPKTSYGLRIIDLANKVPFKEVEKALRYFYPSPKITKETMNRYKEIMAEMATYHIKPIKDLDEQLEVTMTGAYKFYSKSKREWVTMTDFGEEYYHVGMKKKGEEFSYAIEFTRWETASNWVIAKNTILVYKPEEILAHFLWEMTFCGYTQAPIQKEIKRLDKIVKDIKSGKAKTVPYSGNLMNDLKDKTYDKSRKGKNDANGKQKGSSKRKKS